MILIALHTPILTVMGMSGESFRLAFAMLAIYLAAALIRMGNWTQNDTFRAAETPPPERCWRSFSCG